MKLRRFTSAGVEMARQYLAAVKESNDVENVTLDGAPFTIAYPSLPPPPTLVKFSKKVSVFDLNL